MYRCLDLNDILFCVMIFMEALLLPYNVTGHFDADCIPLLMRKWKKILSVLWFNALIGVLHQ